MTPISEALGEVAVEASAPKAARGTGELRSSHQATAAITGKTTLELLNLSTVRKRTGTPTIVKVHPLLKEVAVVVEVVEASPRVVVLEAGSKMVAAPTSPSRGHMEPTMTLASLDSRDMVTRSGTTAQSPTWVGVRVVPIVPSRTRARVSVVEVSASIGPTSSSSRPYLARMATSLAVLTRIPTLIRATLANSFTVSAKRLQTSKSSA